MAARAFAREVLSTWREGDVADIVTLLVSELVTNAVLHAGTKVEVAMLRRGQTLRVAVADGSPVLPGQREYSDDAMTGRGLSLVETLAENWGVEVLPDHGKVVWFEVPAAHAEADAPEDLPTSDEIYLPEDEVVIRLLGAPVQLFPATQQHTEALLREYALMAMQYETGQTPPRLVLDMRAVAEQLRAAVDAGRASTDLVVAAPRSAQRDLADACVALEVADRLAADGQLLSAPALPEIRWCREWFLGQVVAQLDGDDPTPWTMAAIRTDARRPVEVDHAAVLDRLHEPVVIADDQNHIAYANRAVEELLGWPPGGLTGQRLTAIVPERLHEAHLAGYTRFQVTRQPRLIGRPVRVPARRSDGSEVDIELRLDAMTNDEGRQLFLALLRPVEETRVASDEDRAHWLRMIDAVLRAVGNTPSPSPERLLGALGDHIGWTFATWWSAKDDGLHLEASWSNRRDDYAGFTAASAARLFSRGEGLPGRVWESGAPLWLSDVVQDANFPRMAVALQHGLRTGCAFPVRRGDEIIGVIELFNDEVRVPDDGLIAAFETLGRVMGVAGC